MRIFIIGGKSGSGKDTLAKLIKEFYIYKKEDTVITSYSKYLKLYASELTSWDMNDEARKPRKYLQEMGDLVRRYDEDFLVKRLIDDINIYGKFCNNIVIKDARMSNEIDEIAIKFDNVYSIYIDNQFRASNLSVDEMLHRTETELETYNDFDITIINDGNIDNLKEKIFKYLEGIENDKE